MISAMPLFNDYDANYFCHAWLDEVVGHRTGNWAFFFTTTVLISTRQIMVPFNQFNFTSMLYVTDLRDLAVIISRH